MATIRLRRRRKAQWWKPFASPRLLLLAVPILMVPMALIMLEDDTRLSPVELAIISLPTAGDSGASTGTALLGRGGTRLPNSVGLPLYANSARVEAARIGRADTAAAAQSTDLDFASAEFAMLHPRTLMKDDLLIGTLTMVYATPMNMDLSLKLFEEFCNAMPDDPFYQVSMDALPIDANLRRAFDRYATTATRGGPVCARMYRNDL